MNIKGLLTTAAEQLNKHLPAILTTVGVAGIGATAWFTYKSSKEITAVVEDIEYKRFHDMPVNRLEELGRLAKVVALPVAVGAASITCIIASYQIQNNRINILTGAVSVLGAEAAKFREKYKETHGEEAYKEFIAPKKTEVRETVDDKGKVKKVVDKTPDKLMTTYGVWFSESEEYMEDDPNYNMAYIREALRGLELKSFQEVLSLNQVYRALGIKETKTGAEWGFERGSFSASADLHPYSGGQDDVFIHWGQPAPLFGKRAVK